MPPFRLYGLFGCNHCIEAEAFLTTAQVPFQTIVANDDVVIDRGIATVLGETASSYPILIYFVTRELVVGFKEGEYRRLVQDFKDKVKGGTLNGVVSDGASAIPADGVGDVRNDSGPAAQVAGAEVSAVGAAV